LLCTAKGYDCARTKTLETFACTEPRIPFSGRGGKKASLGYCDAPVNPTAAQRTAQYAAERGYEAIERISQAKQTSKPQADSSSYGVDTSPRLNGQ
jgi:hypothetical protein